MSLKIHNTSISLLLLEEYIDANGGLEDVEHANAWRAIGSELGIDTKKHPDSPARLRQFFLDHIQKPPISSPADASQRGRSSFPVPQAKRLSAKDISSQPDVQREARQLHSGVAVQVSTTTPNGRTKWVDAQVIKINNVKGYFNVTSEVCAGSEVIMLHLHFPLLIFSPWPQSDDSKQTLTMRDEDITWRWRRNPADGHSQTHSRTVVCSSCHTFRVPRFSPDLSKSVHLPGWWAG